jgi:hypothetical protein
MHARQLSRRARLSTRQVAPSLVRPEKEREARSAVATRKGKKGKPKVLVVRDQCSTQPTLTIILSTSTLTIQTLSTPPPLKALKKSMQGKRAAAAADVGAQKMEKGSTALTLAGMSRSSSPPSYELNVALAGPEPQLTPKRSVPGLCLKSNSDRAGCRAQPSTY